MADGVEREIDIRLQPAVQDHEEVQSTTAGRHAAFALTGTPRTLPLPSRLMRSASGGGDIASMLESGEFIRLLVVDDQPLIRAGLTALLRATPGVDVVGEAADGEQAIAAAKESRPDVVLMDVRMPGTNGLTATRQIIASGGGDGPHVLVLTTFDLDEYVYEALRAGASGFLLKDVPPERLLNAIATVAGGDMLLTPRVVHRLVDTFCRRSDATPRQPRSLDVLTTREVEVLRLVARGMSNTEIASQLVISEATVKTHLNRTMAKLSLASRAQAVVIAYESGLVTPARLSTA